MLNLNKFPIFQTGFRLFFLVAAIMAMASIFLWMLLYSFEWNISINFSVPSIWHAHEMVFGYGMAVIAGFLLTAVKNWTGLPTLSGLPIAILFFLWLVARIMPFIENDSSILIMAIFDLSFISYLIFAILCPIIKAKQWRNMAVAVKIFFILISNLVFYLGQQDIISDGSRIGLYSGFYLIISLILMIGRRVIPFFIENGAGEPVKIINRKWLDQFCLGLFLIFWILIVIDPNSLGVALLSGVLCVLHIVRMAGWYTKLIWKKPLLWSIYLSYAFVILGFFLCAIMGFYDISYFLSLHAFAYGGIGFMTISMMSRVALGHTGRSISDPNKAMTFAFIFILIGAIFRVILPIFFVDQYAIWIIIAQIMWLMAFGLFLIIYTPILISKRADGKLG